MVRSQGQERHSRPPHAQTGFSQPEHRARSKSAGFDYHPIKPIKLEDIEEIFAALYDTAPAPATVAASLTRAG